jgi:hypothetical protein
MIKTVGSVLGDMIAADVLATDVYSFIFSPPYCSQPEAATSLPTN